MGMHRHQAKLLAERRFPTFVTWDISKANQPVFKIGNMELPDCITQAETLEAAIKALHDVRVAAVERLLEAGLPVPYSREPAADIEPLKQLSLKGSARPLLVYIP